MNPVTNAAALQDLQTRLADYHLRAGIKEPLQFIMQGVVIEATVLRSEPRDVTQWGRLLLAVVAGADKAGLNGQDLLDAAEMALRLAETRIAGSAGQVDARKIAGQPKG